jgi:glycosyltransferase involved in cell wall biosynthesis
MTAARSRPELVSVVVPVFNNERTLRAQLDALSSQDYEAPYEVIVVDNGSQDSSRQIALDQAAVDRRVKVASASRRGTNHARNVGSDSAQGDLIAYCDGDDVAAESWLSNLVEAALDCDIVAGSLEISRLNDETVLPWREGPLIGSELPVALAFLPFGYGANLAVWSDALSTVGGWDEGFIIGGTEVDLCWRLQLQSYRICYAPGAVMHYRMRLSLGELFRQALRYGRADVMLYRKFRSHGVKRMPLRTLASTWLRLIRSIPELARSSSSRGRWLYSFGIRAGRIWGSLKYRTIFL